MECTLLHLPTVPKFFTDISQGKDLKNTKIHCSLKVDYYHYHAVMESLKYPTYSTFNSLGGCFF